jgi:iron complex outermembrane recepter protein
MFRGKRTGLREALVGSVALFALSAGLAQAQEANFTIPAQSLDQTLREISRKTGENILFRPEAVSGLRAPALSGKMNAQDAITRVIAGSGLEAIPDGTGGVIVQKKNLAQSDPAAPADQGLLTGTPGVETVVVTGSRIPQTVATSPSPVVVVGQEELKFEGTTDVTTVLNNLPEVFASQNNNVSNGATGTDNVNLRNLGVSRTMVLVDGSRLMPGDPVDPAPDINNIPAALVDHIDVLTGGASAVYGSDALAGVVNFVLRKDFQGIELDSTYSINENDNDNARWRGLTQSQIDQGGLGYAQSPYNVFDGQTTDATLLMGVNAPNDKGNVSIYLGYRSIAAVLQTSRDYSECALVPVTQGDACSGSPNYNQWLSLDNAFGGMPYDYFQNVSHKTGVGQFVPYTGAPNQSFNFNPNNYYQRPDTRYTGGFFAHYDESKELEVYANFMFMSDSSTAQIAPSGLFFGSGTQPDFSVYVNCSNPLMTAQENQQLCGLILPFDKYVTANGHSYWNGAGNAPGYSGNPFGAAGQADLFVARRDVEGGDRTFELRHTSYRMQIGFRGDLGDGWSYNLYAQEGYTTLAQATDGEISASRVQNALEVDPATGKCFAAETGGSLSCVPLNIFNGIGSITPAMLGYVNANAMQMGWTDEKIVSGSTTGSLGDWGAKSPFASDPATMVLGAEYRQENLAFMPDYEYQSGDIEGGSAVPAVPQSGFNVSEGFGELQLPLVQNKPFAEDVSFKGGYRYSSYSAAGATRAWYVSGAWQPVDDYRFRVSLERAVRAPNVLELFSPQVKGLFGSTYPGTDPCATIVTGECAKVPNHGTQLLFCPAQVCVDQTGGNVALSPEASTTRTLGFVYTPHYLDGFTATVDWWDIDVSNYISVLPTQEILDDCYGPNATSSSEAYFCPFVHRTPGGMIYGNGYVSDDAINTGYLKTKGVDFQTEYQIDTNDWWGLNEGTVAVDDIGTYLQSLVNEPAPSTLLTRQVASGSAYDCAGFFGTICGTPAPRWRNKLRLTWESPFDVDVSMQWRFIGATRFDSDTINPLLGGGPGIVHCPNSNLNVAGFQDCSDARISAYDYFDLSATWQVRTGVELRGGVNNIFDVEPPILTEYVNTPFSNGNTTTGAYDVLGRTIFISATIKY